MVRADRYVVLVSVAAMWVIAASGCAMQPQAGAGGDGGISLADTKSPVQLLRNDAAGRVPAKIIADVSDAIDKSVACKPESEDPEGLLRSWHSTIEFALTPSSVQSVDSVVDTLAASYVDQGWKLASEGGSSILHKRFLTSDRSPADIQIVAVSAEEGAAYSPIEELESVSVQIEVQGPCVMTDGPDSEEVLKLEGRDAPE